MSNNTCTTCAGTGKVPFADTVTGEGYYVTCFGCGGSGKR